MFNISASISRILEPSPQGLISSIKYINENTFLILASNDSTNSKSFWFILITSKAKLAYLGWIYYYLEITCKKVLLDTGKSLSEALIFASINPQYDNRLFIELPWKLHVLPMFCTCSFHGNSMNNLLSYCGLVDARISAFEKDLPVNFLQRVFEKIA